MAWPTHILAAGGYVFDKNGNILIIKIKTGAGIVPEARLR